MKKLNDLTRNMVAGLGIFVFGSVICGQGLPLKSEITTITSGGMHVAGETISNAIIESKPVQ